MFSLIITGDPTGQLAHYYTPVYNGTPPCTHVHGSAEQW